MGNSNSNVCSVDYRNTNHGFLLFSPGNQYIVIGSIRILAMLCFLVYNYRNKQLLGRKGADSVNIVRGLVLPSYYPVIYSLIGIDFVFACVDIGLNVHDIDPRYEKNIYIWLIPLQFGLFHTIYEGITIFMMKFGAGIKAFKESLRVAFIWGVVSFVLIFVAINFFFSFNGLNDSVHFNAVYFIFLAYNILLCVFYLVIWFVPMDLIYMRPALKEYAKYNVVLYIYWIVFSSIIHFTYDQGWTCASSIFAGLLVGFMQPFAIWRLLQADSQYWQGLTPDNDNPLKEVWDQVDIETAETMGEGISRLTDIKKSEKSRGHVPLLHFGLIEMNKEIGFVAGGFSRVYFGKLKKEKVALKIMFAMELTPAAVLEFYEEAKILHLLKSDRVVCCKGVCVMPPAVAIVLEYCEYGSLFDFIYKVRANDESRYVEVDPSLIGIQQRTNSENTIDSLGALNLSHSNIIRTTEFVANPIAHTNTALGTPMLTTNDENNEGRTNSARASKDNLWSTFIETPPPRLGGSQKSKTPASFFSTSKGGGSNNNSNSNSKSIDPDLAGGETFNLRSSLEKISRSFLAEQKPPVAFSVPISIRYNMVLDVITAIDFLHSKGYMHCDIKSLNFLVSANYRIKLTDFGEARHVDQQPKRARPPIPAINWAPPEVLSPFANPYSYTQKSDVFGLAIVISEILTLELPYGTECDKISSDVWYHKLSSEKIRPNLPAGIPIQLQESIEGAWASNQHERPTAPELKRQLHAKDILTHFGIGESPRPQSDDESISNFSLSFHTNSSTSKSNYSSSNNRL